MQLVYAACTPARPGMKDPCNLPCPLPALLKPEPLYTGKQVSSEISCCLWSLVQSMKPQGCQESAATCCFGLALPCGGSATGRSICRW